MSKLRPKIKGENIFTSSVSDSINSAVLEFDPNGVSSGAKVIDDIFSGRESARRVAEENPDLVEAQLCKRKFSRFVQEFWGVTCAEKLAWNWHMDVFCDELQEVAERVARNEVKDHDLIFNVPPGTSKSTVVSIMFVPYCWSRWPWMRFICTSYNSDLSLEHAEASREIVRSVKYKRLFKNIKIKRDKDLKSNFRVVYKREDTGPWRNGGNRLSTSVTGSVTGFHAHILLVDDPIDPKGALSDKELKVATDYMDKTLPTRKVDKEVSVTVLIMQRLSEDDPTGHWIDKKKENVRHICLPCDCERYREFVKPAAMITRYVDGLLDPKRLSRRALNDLELDMGQVAFAGQMGQNPVPPEGGMFKMGNCMIIDAKPPRNKIMMTARYWDKAATRTIEGKFTAGCKMSKLTNGNYLVEDMKRGRWDTHVRDTIMLKTAEADGKEVIQYHEQEPGSGGKDSAKATSNNLSEFNVVADIPSGNKIRRADPYSSQCNAGNVMLLRGEWNKAFIDEHKIFPNGRFTDQVDSASGAYSKIMSKKSVERIY